MKLKSKLLLRIAVVFMLLHTIGHTFGALSWSEPPNAKVAAVINGMQTEHFDFMGRSATLAQFYNGYGISMILVLLFVSIQLWLLASNPVKSMIVAMGVFLLIMGICEYIYFFPMAALFTVLSAVCVWISVFRLEKH